MSDLNPQESEFERLLRESSFDDAPRPKHRDRLREQALARFDGAIQSHSSNPSWKRILISGREIMRRPIPRLIAVCATCIAIALVWTFLPGHQSTAEAFNRYAAAIFAAKTARYQMEITAEGQPPKKIRAYYMAPGRFRQEISPMVNIGDMRAGKMMMLSPATKTAVIMVPRGAPEERRKAEDQFEHLRDLLAKGQEEKDEKYVRIGEKEFGGKRAVGFRFDSPAATVTLWGDPATSLPVRIETVWSGIPRTEVVMSDFETDVKLEESLFDMTVPEGYKVQTFDIDASKATEADLIAALKVCADIGEEEFPEAITTAAVQKMILKYALRANREKKTLTDADTQQLMKHTVTIGRGSTFVLEIPESAEPRYAGKGIKRNTPDRPIFWYKPADSQKYRVIYADLKVREADEAPQIPDAQRIEKASKSAKPAESK